MKRSRHEPTEWQWSTKECTWVHEVECTCGWASEPWWRLSDARKAFDHHLTAVGLAVAFA
jgi:hypothetical protein